MPSLGDGAYRPGHQRASAAMLALLVQTALIAAFVGLTLLTRSPPRDRAPSLALFTVDRPRPRLPSAVASPPPPPLAVPALPAPPTSPAIIVVAPAPPVAADLAMSPSDAPAQRMSRGRQAFVTLAPATGDRPAVTSAATLRTEAWRELSARLAGMLVDQPPLYLAVRVSASGEVIDLRVDGVPLAADRVATLRAAMLGTPLFALADPRQADYWQALPPLAPGAIP